jgi:hypothetical protein
MIQHVPMDEVIGTIEFAEALEFFVLAARCTKAPTKSYAQLHAAIRKAGFQPEQCIPMRITETYWNEASNHRMQTAWMIFLRMVKLWSKVCCRGLECKSVSSTKHLLADDLTGFEFDHLHPEEKHKLSILDMFIRYGLKNVQTAVAAMRDSAVTCRSCHDSGHKAGGKDVGKNY